MSTEKMLDQLIGMQTERLQNLKMLQTMDNLARELGEFERDEVEKRVFGLMVNTAQIELEMSTLLSKCSIQIWAKMTSQTTAPFFYECSISEDEPPF